MIVASRRLDIYFKFQTETWVVLNQWIQFMFKNDFGSQHRPCTCKAIHLSTHSLYCYENEDILLSEM